MKKLDLRQAGCRRTSPKRADGDPAGFDEMIDGKPVKLTYGGAGHIMGTYRMGEDPKTSVVDSFQRSHDHNNLYLVGSGTFPTGGTANPTLTLSALALRTADSIVGDLRSQRLSAASRAAGADNMKRTDSETRNLAGRRVGSSLSLSRMLRFAGVAAADDCPACGADHIPALPPPPLNIDTVKDAAARLSPAVLRCRRRGGVRFGAEVHRAERGSDRSGPRWCSISTRRRLPTGPICLPTILVSSPVALAMRCPRALAASTNGSSSRAPRPSSRRLKLFKAAKANGVAVIFITGRPDKQRDATIINLDHEGFDGWTELRTRPDRDDLPDRRRTYKTAERTKVEDRGLHDHRQCRRPDERHGGRACRVPLQGAQSVLLHPLKKGRARLTA